MSDRTFHGVVISLGLFGSEKQSAIRPVRESPLLLPNLLQNLSAARLAASAMPAWIM
jgi:hypothetical protein